MPENAEYYLCVRAGEAVGPHDLNSLREWVELGVISPDWKVRSDDEEPWISVSEIPNFYDFPPSVRERLEVYRRRPHEEWRSHPATPKQLKKLKYFGLPFAAAGLTKGRASELIDAFASIDPEREDEYQDRPATVEQTKKIRSIGGDPTDLSYSDARDCIEELTTEKEQDDEEAEFTFELLEHKLNDGDVREILKYKKLTKEQLRQMLAYVSQHVPDWQQKSGYDLGELVPRLFPGQVKVQRSTSRKSGRPRTSSGCLLFLIAPFAVLVKVIISWIASK